MAYLIIWAILFQAPLFWYLPMCISLLNWDFQSKYLAVHCGCANIGKISYCNWSLKLTSPKDKALFLHTHYILKEGLKQKILSQSIFFKILHKTQTWQIVAHVTLSELLKKSVVLWLYVPLVPWLFAMVIYRTSWRCYYMTNPLLFDSSLG